MISHETSLPQKDPITNNKNIMSVLVSTSLSRALSLLSFQRLVPFYHQNKLLALAITLVLFWEP